MAAAVDPGLIERFRAGLEAGLRGDARIRSVLRDDRPDGTVLATRFEVAPQLWIELCLRPHIPQVRAGIVTDSRWLSEDLEQLIEDSGDTMSEFLELGFEEAGLSWPAPPVEHYREQGKYFYFSTGLELRDSSELADPAIADRVRRMFEGYYHAFRPAIAKAGSA